jgi:hypothetical protein
MVGQSIYALFYGVISSIIDNYIIYQGGWIIN